MNFLIHLIYINKIFNNLRILLYNYLIFEIISKLNCIYNLSPEKTKVK